MVIATLGPPPAVVGARGSDDAGVTRAPSSPDRDGFADALRDAEPRRQAPANKANARHKAAGPTNGKLQNHPDAEAAGGTDSKNPKVDPQASDRATERASDNSAVKRSADEADAETTPADADAVVVAPVVVADVAVPAVTDAPTEAVVPAETAAAATAAVAVAAPVVAAQVTVAAATESTQAPAVVTAPAPAPVADATVADDAAAALNADGIVDVNDAPPAPKGAATLTLSIAQAPSAADDAVAVAAQLPQPGAQNQAPAGDVADDAAVGTQAKATAATPATPSQGATPAQAAASADPGQAALAGAGVGMAGQRSEAASRTGLATPGEHLHVRLAHEIADHVKMSVGQGGKEIVLSMRPPELGHVVIRMVMNDGVLQAQIIADKPEAAKMLQQAMPHLTDALESQGYDLAGMDIAHHQEAREQFAAGDQRRGTAHGDGRGEAASGTSSVAPVATAAPRADGSVPLDLLV